MSRKRAVGWVSGFAVLAFPFFGLAQTQPSAPPTDAGRILQEVLPERVEPAPAPLVLPLEAQALSDIAPGGETVEVSSIVFEGNTVYSQDTLMAVLGDEVLGQAYDLGGLRDLANRISVFYRESGYSFARAFVPVQDLDDGTLLMQIVEGRFGRIELDAQDPQVSEKVAQYLAPLVPGGVIEQSVLERQFAILGDVPGIAVRPAITAGAEPGTGDLLVSIEEIKAWGGSVGADNHGNRFSGEYRGVLRLNRPMLFTFGDRLDLTALYSSESLLLGSTEYSLPLGVSGLRGKVGYNHTDYELGQGADAQGDARVTSIGVSYPLVRNPNHNLGLSLEYQYKDLSDTFAEGLAVRATEAHVVPLTLSFDQRDELLGGGLSYGALTLTAGRTERQDDLAGEITEDDIDFGKLNLQWVRVQSLPVLPMGWTLYGSLSAQLSSTTLDSSETKSLGGANGVRAYPQGEATGSEGYIGQLELRTSYPKASPYLFVDYGYIPQRGEAEVRRSLSGAGFGVRGNIDRLSGDVSVAWKLDGEEATSDTSQRDPRVWFSVRFEF